MKTTFILIFFLYNLEKIYFIIKFMEKLLEILKNENINSSLEIQKADFQYKSLEKLNNNLITIQ